MALFLWPESSYKSPNCIHKSPNSPNSGHAIYYIAGRVWIRFGFGFQIRYDIHLMRFGSDSIRRRFDLFWAGIRFGLGLDCLDTIRFGFGFKFVWYWLHLIRLNLDLLLEISDSIRWRFDSVLDSIRLGFDSIWTWFMPFF